MVPLLPESVSTVKLAPAERTTSEVLKATLVLVVLKATALLAVPTRILFPVPPDFAV